MAETTELDEDEQGAVGGSDGGNPGGTITIEDFEIDDGNLASNSGIESQKTKLRPRCQYAEDCYRKKPHHRKTYCHPGDEDWNGGENRRLKPRCPFGEFCTRWYNMCCCSRSVRPSVRYAFTKRAETIRRATCVYKLVSRGFASARFQTECSAYAVFPSAAVR